MTTITHPEPPAQIIEQKATDVLQGIAAAPERTIGSVVYEITLVIPPLAVLLDVPASFVQGLQDCAEGRTVDMETAMSQLPPDRVL